MGAIDIAPFMARHRWTVNAYHSMSESGVFPPEGKFELIDGEVIDMAPIGSRHASTVNRLLRLLTVALKDTAIVRVQDPIQLDAYSEPQPDVAVARPRDDFYFEAHPRPDDVLLLVEVADTSARYDREIKLPLYARCGVREVWIVDLDAGLLHCHREPLGDGYLQTTVTRTPGPTPLTAMPGVVIDLAGVLPPRTDHGPAGAPAEA